MKLSKEQQFGAALLAVVALLWYYLHTRGLLHEQVTSKILSSGGTIVPDAVTGLPQFDSRAPETIPANFSSAVAPIDKYGKITKVPSDPAAASCPDGFTLFKDVANGTYSCVPDVAGKFSAENQVESLPAIMTDNIPFNPPLDAGCDVCNDPAQYDYLQFS